MGELAINTSSMIDLWYYSEMMDDLTILAAKTQHIFKKYGFRKVGIFGSRSRGDNRADSDADFLFSDQGRPLGFLEKQQAEEELKSVLGDNVDLGGCKFLKWTCPKKLRTFVIPCCILRVFHIPPQN